ncbi:MAG: FtsQ-type POTRA domain-containing protein [Verrucomicrobiae bacterium]|nr:FtsQ-type POTRA domain-containing protein [Verrucomicrobiae bacterium]
MFRRWFNKSGENRRVRRSYKMQIKLPYKQRVTARFNQGVRIAIAMLAVLLAGMLAFHAFTYFTREFFEKNPRYNVASIEVETDGRLAREQIIQLAGVHEGQNIFTLDLAAIRDALETHPVIRKAEILRQMPNKLRIIVSERVPIAMFYTRPQQGAARREAVPSVSYLIDNEGVVMRPVDLFRRPEKRLPLLRNVNAPDIRPGQRLRNEQVQRALDLVHLGEANGIVPYADYDWVDLSRDDCVVLCTARGGRFTFSPTDFTTQLRRMKYILQHAKQRNLVVKTCDLSVGTDVPVTFFTQQELFQPAAAAAPAGVLPGIARATHGGR